MEGQGKENCVKLFQILWWVILSRESLRLEQVPRRHHKGTITSDAVIQGKYRIQ